MPDKKITEQSLRVFERFSKYISEHGYFNTIANLIMFFVSGIIIYCTFNPEDMFERYDRYVETKHNASTEYRIESGPKVKFYLNQMVKELNADRAYVMEYHNGKSNPSGLQWQYADMTFLNDESEDILDEYQNISLVRYAFAYRLYETGFYSGTVRNIGNFDKRLALRLEANDVAYISAMMLYGENLCGIGFLGVSYKNEPSLKPEEIQKILTKYTIAIAPLLDGTNAMIKNK